uniref:Uncharacterized protein n=1 Tax=Rhodosorus marinus TaxID=101924 RepID=A0A7S0BND2_9RHOD
MRTLPLRLVSSTDHLEHQPVLASRWTTDLSPQLQHSGPYSHTRSLGLKALAPVMQVLFPSTLRSQVLYNKYSLRENHSRAFEDIVDNSAPEDRARARVRSSSVVAGAGCWLRDLPRHGI